MQSRGPQKYFPITGVGITGAHSGFRHLPSKADQLEQRRDSRAIGPPSQKVRPPWLRGGCRNKGADAACGDYQTNVPRFAYASRSNATRQEAARRCRSNGSNIASCSSRRDRRSELGNEDTTAERCGAAGLLRSSQRTLSPCVSAAQWFEPHLPGALVGWMAHLPRLIRCLTLRYPGARRYELSALPGV